MTLIPAEIESRMRAFTDTCTHRGLKATRQRIDIFREIARTQEHPDAETIHRRVRKRIPAVSLDTVYRTLCRLEQEGLLSRVEILNERARFDANTAPHHHFICTNCGLIRDFYSPELDNFEPPDEVRSWGSVFSTHIELRGICSRCLSKKGTTSGRG